jgi:hypothetical protein
MGPHERGWERRWSRCIPGTPGVVGCEPASWIGGQVEPLTTEVICDYDFHPPDEVRLFPCPNRGCCTWTTRTSSGSPLAGVTGGRRGWQGSDAPPARPA